MKRPGGVASGKYALETPAEAERLERQSRSSLFSFEEELSGFRFDPGSSILDAGCGSGIVARYLARRFPLARVTGWDRSRERISFAARLAESDGLANLGFSAHDLCTPCTERFDFIVCRYVLEHMATQTRAQALANLRNALNPRGHLYVVDVDGILANLHPQTSHVRGVLRALIDRSEALDLHVGRKIPQELLKAGFGSVKWRIRTIEVTEERMEEEARLMRERFDALLGYLSDFLGSPGEAKRFTSEYLECMRQPGATLFYNMFLVDASGRAKPRLVR